MTTPGVVKTVHGLILAGALLALAGLVPAQRASGTSEHDGAELLAQGVATYTRALETEERGARLDAFRQAERLFARVAGDGVSSPELYTNLGNAALQAERVGSAVLAYRRALLLDPDHPRALQNLAYARALLPDWVPRPEVGGLVDTFFAWHRTLARSDRLRAAALCFAAAALLLAASIRLGQPLLRSAAILPGLVWVALLASALLDSGRADQTAAVVTADEVVARAADSSRAPAAFPEPLPGGAELRVLERRPPWYRVRLANGRDAWVPASSLTTVTPAAEAGAS